MRDRVSYAFAVVSAAAALRLEGDRIIGARLALGGVATKPWRAHEAEQILRGARADASIFRSAAEAALAQARPAGDNSFKIELARRIVVRPSRSPPPAPLSAFPPFPLLPSPPFPELSPMPEL